MVSIDLHMHSIKSDGALSPKQLIDEAVKNNVKILSITDHDTLGAYTEDLFSYATEKGVYLIVGVEISTKFNGKGFHILGYNIDYKDVKLNCLLKKIREIRSR